MYQFLKLLFQNTHSLESDSGGSGRGQWGFSVEKSEQLIVCPKSIPVGPLFRIIGGWDAIPSHAHKVSQWFYLRLFVTIFRSRESSWLHYRLLVVFKDGRRLSENPGILVHWKGSYDNSDRGHADRVSSPPGMHLPFNGTHCLRCSDKDVF